MLKHRILTALVLFILSFFVLFLIPERMFSVIILLICLAGVYEISNMYQFNRLSQTGLMLAMVILAFFLNYNTAYDASQLIRITSVIIWCFIAPLILIWRPVHLSKTIISCLSLLIFLLAFYAIVMLHSLFGPLQLLSIMAIAWVADIGAFFVGRNFGRHKLAPQISPGKSIEGAIGGLILVILYLLILKYFRVTIYLSSYASVIKFGFILTTVSIIGDLLESWFKRVAKVKDSGSILPGHGGVFDRVDSILAVLAIAFAMVRGQL